jgi:hypothetical protein
MEREQNSVESNHPLRAEALGVIRQEAVGGLIHRMFNNNADGVGGIRTFAGRFFVGGQLSRRLLASA